MIRILQMFLLPVFFVITGVAHAIEPIPDETGWSGFVNIGAGGLRAESNLVAGIDKYSISIGNATIDSLSDAPKEKTLAIPQLNGYINYTFSTRTQLFVGNNLEDIIRLDLVSTFGVRQQFADKSIIALSSVSSPAFNPIQVWADPYVVGVDRVETDRSSNGLRLEYDKILATGFGLQYTQLDYEIDNELSGTTQLGLPAAQAALLNREGTSKRLVGYYRFAPVGRNIFELRVGFKEEDRDGKAMSNDQNEISLVHAYIGDRFTLATNISYFTSEYDTVNPVFNATQDDDTLGLAFFVFDKKIFNSKNWWGQASVVYFNRDSNINFYDESSLALVAGAQFRF